jgi:hypothetical protein
VTYQPYFQGDYDRDGNLVNPDDPFLFWLIPIQWFQAGRLPADFPNDAILDSRTDPTFGQVVLVDFTRIHVLRKPRPSSPSPEDARPPQPVPAHKETNP